MKKINLKKIYLPTIISLIFLLSFFLVISFSRADDDGGDQGDYRQPTPVVQPQPVVQPEPIIIQQPVVQPVVQPAVQPVATPTSVTPAPKQTNTVVSQETVVTVPDNSAILAALKDSDKDGVPDVIDKYPGEDDFAYSLLDNNHNGIADDLEALLK